MAISLNDLTMGELDQIEQLTGQSLGDMGDPHTPKAKLMTALAWAAKRREDPSFTFNQAEAMTLAEIQALTGDSAEDDDPKAL